MRPKALLLDLDDTLISFEHGLDLNRCWLEACERHLAEARPQDITTLIAAIQKHARWYWRDAERHRIGRRNLPEARRQIVAEALVQTGIAAKPGTAMQIALTYGKLRDELVSLLPGAIDTLVAARRLGLKLALITNGASEPQRAKIDRFRLAPYFDRIIVEGEYGIGKPEPAVYQHALEVLGVRAADTWMVGDNYEWEIVAPARLGIRGVWINPSGKPIKRPEDTQPYLVFRTIEELQQELSTRFR